MAVSQGRLAGNGLPNNGFYAANTIHPKVQLSYRDANNGDNMLRLVEDASEAPRATIDVADGHYAQLDLAVTSGEGISNFQVVLSYADGSSEVLSSQAPDWFDELSSNPQMIGGGEVYYLRNGMDRITSGSYQQAADPALFGVRFVVDAGRTLQSFTVTQFGDSTDSRDQVLALLGGVLSTTALPPPPSAQRESAVTDAAFANLESPGSATSSGSTYDRIARPMLTTTADNRLLLSSINETDWRKGKNVFEDLSSRSIPRADGDNMLDEGREEAFADDGKGSPWDIFAITRVL